MAKTEHDEHIFVNNFVVDMGGEQKHIRKVSPITMRIPKIETTTGLDKWKTWRPGRPNFGNITFEGSELKDDNTVESWVKEAYDGNEARKDITIKVRNQKGEDVRVFNLFSVLPVAYSKIDIGSQGGAQTMHWTLEVNVQRIEMA
jgi:phage tail-like protein